MQIHEEIPEKSRSQIPRNSSSILLFTLTTQFFRYLANNSSIFLVNSGNKSDYSNIFYFSIIFVDIVDQFMSFFSQFGGGFPFGGFGGHDEDDGTYHPNSAGSG